MEVFRHGPCIDSCYSPTRNFSIFRGYARGGKYPILLSSEQPSGVHPSLCKFGAQTAVVGHFTPYDFAVNLNVPNFAPGCRTNAAFTYIGQSFVHSTAPVMSVMARNHAGTATLNYTGNGWTITNASLMGRRYIVAFGTLDATGLPNTATDPVIVDLGGASSGQGTLTFSAGTGLKFTRGAPLAPFNAEISLAINVIDTDNVTYAINPARFGAASAGIGIRRSILTGGGAVLQRRQFRDQQR